MEEEKKLVAFSQMNSFEEAFRYLQQHPDIASRLYCDQLMARAFQLQIDRKDRESRLCVKWSLALSYSFQMGVDGIGLFFKRWVGLCLFSIMNRPILKNDQRYCGSRASF